MTYLYVFIGGGFGCLARYAMAVLVARHYEGNYPLATFLSNTLSCAIMLAVLSFFTAQDSAKWARPLLIIGFCGGFSTFSTFSFETAQLIKNGNLWVAAANMVISIAVCVAIALRLAR